MLAFGRSICEEFSSPPRWLSFSQRILISLLPSLLPPSTGVPQHPGGSLCSPPLPHPGDTKTPQREKDLGEASSGYKALENHLFLSLCCSVHVFYNRAVQTSGALLWLLQQGQGQKQFLSGECPTGILFSPHYWEKRKKKES